jgi:DNA-binding transcriptional MerR regulator
MTPAPVTTAPTTTAPTTTPLSISDVAARTGFPASTLRYYEQVGLLPESDRTPAGYRIFDESVLPRLAFIGRAKQLGLPLEEIRTLVAVWDEGLCAHVQDRLRGLIATQSLEVRARVAELEALAAQLDASAVQLAQNAPSGGCGDGCGCTTLAVPQQPVPAVLPLGRTRLRAGPAEPVAVRAPVACSLPESERPGRVLAWEDVLLQVERRKPLPGGVRLVFAPSPELAGRLADLAAREHRCCAFLTFVLRPTAEALVLDVQAPGDAAPLVRGLFGSAA